MNTKIDSKNILHYLARPWFWESLVFFIALWQESFRLSSRTSHKVLPIGVGLQNYYYYNFGDFVNGYVIAYIIDGVINFTLLKTSISYKIAGFKITKRGNAILASLFSSLIVVVFELMQSTSTTSDVNDIPAGILGAFLYLLIRLLALKITMEYDIKNK